MALVSVCEKPNTQVGRVKSELAVDLLMKRHSPSMMPRFVASAYLRRNVRVLFSPFSSATRKIAAAHVAAARCITQIRSVAWQVVGNVAADVADASLSMWPGLLKALIAPVCDPAAEGALLENRNARENAVHANCPVAKTRAAATPCMVPVCTTKPLVWRDEALISNYREECQCAHCSWTLDLTKMCLAQNGKTQATKHKTTIR